MKFSILLCSSQDLPFEVRVLAEHSAFGAEVGGRQTKLSQCLCHASRAGFCLGSRPSGKTATIAKIGAAHSACSVGGKDNAGWRMLVLMLMQPGGPNDKRLPWCSKAFPSELSSGESAHLWQLNIFTQKGQSNPSINEEI